MSKKIQNDKYNYEIQCWIEAEPTTLTRLRKFYESIVSIHLGGEGLMAQHRNGMREEKSLKEMKALYKNYKTNYPK